ncbi:MAG: PTS sugar transporter subunit IIA [Sandaracinaceae bacterium]
MRLADILLPDRVTVQLVAEDKPSALRGLARLLVTPDGPDEESIAQVFEQREALASTGVGSGVAIPHGRMHGADELRAAVGICTGGVDFDAIDGRPAYILVAVLGPIAKTGEHLKALARFSRVLRRAPVREQLLAASSAAAAFEIILEADQ